MIKFLPRNESKWLIAGALAIVALCVGAIVDSRTFLACWLAAWWTCAGAVLGAQANLWLHDLTGGTWGGALRPIWRRAAAAMPALLAAMLPLFGAVWTFYPWSDSAWVPDTHHPAFQALWLSPAFVTARLLAYAAAWQALSWASAGQGRDRVKGFSAIGLIAYGVTISLASVDLVMALMPEWHSSGFGLIAVTMYLKVAFAVGVACAAYGTGAVMHARPLSPQLGRDWGNLLLMYVMMWAYLAFVQFLIIWAENLPAEIAWYVPRMQTAWVWLGAVLVVLGYFVPQLLLLLRAIKHDRRRLGAIAVGLCVVGWLESIWIVLPSVRDLSWHALWMAPLSLAGMSILLTIAAAPDRVSRRTRRRPAVAEQGSGQ